MTFRLTPSRFALSYIALGILALALLAVPLWYGFRANVGTFRAYVPGAEMQGFVDRFQREGPQAVAAAMDEYAARLPPDQIAIFAGPQKERLAGNLPRWPAEVPEAPGAYGLVIGVGDASVRVVALHVTLPGGYSLLMGRESVRFESLVARFWYGVAGAVAIVLALGFAFAWLLRRAHGRLEALVASRTAELRSSEARFRSLTELSSDFFWETDTEHRYTAIELGWAYTGVRNNPSKLGRARWEIPYVSPDAAAWAAHRAAIAARERFVDFRFSRIENGEERFYQHSGEPRYDAAGNFLGYRGVGRDVTERKRAEEALRASEQRYALAMEAAEEAHWDWIIPTDEYYAARSHFHIYGLPRDFEYTGRAQFLAAAPFHAEDRARYTEAVKALFAGRDSRLTMDLRLFLGGETRWVQIRGLVTRDAAGVPVRYTGTVRDITDRKRLELALGESAQRYARVMQASEDGFWEWVVATDEFYASPRMLALYGLPPDTVFRGREDFLSRFPFHVEDLKLWREAVAAHLAGQTARVDVEVRAKLQGQTRWIHLTAICLRDASGAEERWTGSVSDVTERRRAQEALRVSEDRYARAMEGSSAGHWDWNIVSDEMFVSERAREMLCLPGGSLPRTRVDIMALVPMHPEDRAQMAGAVTAGIQSGVHEREYRVIPRPGEVRWLRTSAKVYRDERGAAVRMTGSLIDITERKLAADALRASEERYSLAMEASEEGHFDVDLDTDEHFTSERLNEIHGFPPGTRTAKRSEFIKLIRFYGDDAEKYRAALAAAEASGGPERYECEFRIVRPSGEVRWLTTRGKVTRDAEGRALRRTGVVADITEAKLAEDALRRSEASLLEAQRLAQIGNFSWQVREGEVSWSEQVYRIFEFEPASRVTLERIATRVHPDDVPMLRDMVERAQQAVGDFEYEHRILMPDGRVKHVHLVAHRVSGAGDRLEYIGAVQDITARKRAEEALRLSEQRYALAVAGATDGIWDWDLTNDMFYRSPRNQQITMGRASDGIDVRRPDEWAQWFQLHPDDVPRRDTAVREHIEGRTPLYEIEFRVRHQDGTYHWVQARGVCIRDASGRALRFAGSTSDIDARKRAEEALQLSDMRYAVAMEVAEEGHFDWNVQTDEIFSSARALRVVGVPPGRKYRTRSEVMAQVRYHPDDGPRISEEWRAALAGSGTEYEFEYRILRGEAQEPRWIRGRWAVFRDAAGVALRVVGVVADITERKLAVDELRESEARFRALTELSSDWYWEQDENLRFTYLSSQALALTGYTGESSVGKTRWEIDNMTPLSCSWAEHQAVLAARKPFRDLECRRVGPDGTVRYLSMSGAPIFDAHGRFRGYRGIGRNITARKRIEEELRSRQEMLELAQKSAQAIAFEWRIGADGPDGNRWSPELAAMYGVAPEAYDGSFERWKDLVHPEDWPAVRQAIQHAHRTGEVSAEYRVVHPDRSVHWLHARGRMFFDAQGKPARMVGFMHEVTERKLGEERLRLSEERYALAMEASEEGHFDWDVASDGIFASTHLKNLLDLPAHLEYRTRGDIVAHMAFCPGESERIAQMARKVLAGAALQHEFEYRLLPRGSGEPRSIHARWKIFRDASGAAQRVIGVISDITARKVAEQALRRTQHYLAEAQGLSHIGSWAFNADGFRYWSDELFKIHGLDPAGKAPSIPEYVALVHPEDRDFVAREIDRLLAGAAGFDFKKRIVRPDGEVRLVRCVGIRATTDGDVPEFVGSGMDVTEQQRTEEALRQSEERYALAVAGSNEGIFDWDLVSDRVYVSYRAQELFGLPRGELWRPRRDWRHILSFHPDDTQRLHDSIKAHIEGGTPTYDVEFRIMLPDGAVRWFRQRGIALRDASGKAYRVVGSIGDVTERHIVEEELKAVERKLRQAQRLEAMGTLAGGIAHDFNNILGAILGYGEMALRDAAKGSRLARDLDSIVVAGERGRALVDRVLAFSRSGVGERVPVNVEKVVREALDLVSAKLPPNVTLHAKLHAGRAAMLGDATQVHQVLTNLASNAIQAMPAGGTLRVALRAQRLETARAPTIGSLDPGDYLVLEVADSGTGIAPEILDRIFDPFFTTKDVGTGTGLGLSLVHGIVTEVGGAIDVASKVGAGSSFTVYLPRSGEAEDASRREDPELPRGEGERVLVVDDEEALVKLATRTLEELGYAPVGFTSSSAALAAFRADPQRFDALITDERMPGMSGSALIREVRGIRDRIPIVLMSGYTGGAVAARAREAGAEEVLKKPLSARDLAASLARVLHS